MIQFRNDVPINVFEDGFSFASITVNDFDDDSAQEFEDKLNKAHRTDQPIFPVQVSSHGGLVNSCLQMKSAIDRSEIPVLTYAPDRAYSCGFALLAFGTKGYRFISEQAFTMAHQAKYFTGGKDAEVENRVEHHRRSLDMFYSLLDEACDQPQGFFKDRWEDKNNLNDYLNAEETLQIGAADEIGNPQVKAKAEINWTVQR